MKCLFAEAHAHFSLSSHGMCIYCKMVFLSSLLNDITLVLEENLVSDIFIAFRKMNKTVFKNQLCIFSFDDACKQ